MIVSWPLDGEAERKLRWTWREQGGPQVTEPTRRGFGSRLIESAMAAEPGGRVDMAFNPEGLICVLEVDFRP